MMFIDYIYKFNKLWEKADLRDSVTETDLIGLCLADYYYGSYEVKDRIKLDRLFNSIIRNGVKCVELSNQVIIDTSLTVPNVRLLRVLCDMLILANSTQISNEVFNGEGSKLYFTKVLGKQIESKGYKSMQECTKFIEDLYDKTFSSENADKINNFINEMKKFDVFDFSYLVLPKLYEGKIDENVTYADKCMMFDERNLNEFLLNNWLRKEDSFSGYDVANRRPFYHKDVIYVSNLKTLVSNKEKRKILSTLGISLIEHKPTSEDIKESYLLGYFLFGNRLALKEANK